jgi:uncharacterized protein with ParB-like and HNH nuclease domain
MFFVRVVVKARFLDSLATDPKFLTLLLTTLNQQTYAQNFSSLAATAAEKKETDGECLKSALKMISVVYSANSNK